MKKIIAVALAFHFVFPTFVKAGAAAGPAKNGALIRAAQEGGFDMDSGGNPGRKASRDDAERHERNEKEDGKGKDPCCTGKVKPWQGPNPRGRRLKGGTGKSALKAAGG